MQFTTFVMILSLQTLTNQQLVYSQLQDFKTYDINTQQDNLQIDLGQSFQSSQQYSIWGWYKSNQSNPAISNIITLKNLTGSDTFLQTKFNNDFPACPYTSNELDQNETLKEEEEVSKNPNCDYENLQSGQEEALLYVNYDLDPAEGDSQTYSLVFLFQNGQKDGISQMVIEGFQGLPRSDSWAFFGISADYQNGSVTIYNKIFDGLNQPQIKSFAINYPQFQLKKNAILVVAGVEQNPFFDSFSGFLGTIGNLEMSTFYTPNIAFQWIGYAPNSSRQYNSSLVDFVYDVYDPSENLQSYGKINNEFAQPGQFTPLFTLDPNRIGNQYYSNSYLPLGELDFTANNSPNKSMSFLYYLQYDENLPDSQRILTRGNQDQNGYMEINLDKVEGGRVLNMQATGEDGKQINWTSPTTFKEGERYYFIVGLSQSIGNSVRPVYIDNEGGNDFAVLSDNFKYNFGPQNVTLFNNEVNQPRSTGHINMYRFIALDSGSPAVNFFNKYSSKPLRDKINLLPNEQDRLCKLRASYYEDAGCFFCNEFVVTQDNQCVRNCPAGFKNALTDICVPCVEDNCAEVSPVQWKFNRVNNNKFQLIPNRKLLNFNQVDYDNLFNIAIKGEQMSTDDFTYKLTPNQDTQIVDVDMDWKNDLRDEDLSLSVSPQIEPLIFDENRNVLKASSSDVYVDRVCYVSSDREKIMKLLAYIVLFGFVLVFAILLLVTLCCWSKYSDLGGIWKFFIHHWMKLQLVAFLFFLCAYRPCCVKAFLNILYKYAVSWDHHLREWIDSFVDDNQDYNQGFIEKQLPMRFQEKYVKPFLLHNMGIFFLVHIVIFLAYLIVKIWDCFLTTSKSCFFKLLNYLEYTLIIVGFLLVHMQIFVFSMINFRRMSWDHSYFIICFVIAVIYLVFFGLFWLYALYRLMGSTEYFIGNNNGNSFYYFFAGFRDEKYARTYDLWYVLCHFAVGLAIGLFLYECTTQMYIVLIALVVCFLILLTLRPWKSAWLLLADILSQLLILAGVVIFFIYYLLDKGGCRECGNREGWLCWLLVLLLFVGLLIGLLGVLLALLCGCSKVQETVVEEQDIYHHTKEQEIINNYENVNERYVNEQRVVNNQQIMQDEYREDIHLEKSNKNMEQFIEEAHINEDYKNEDRAFVRNVQESYHEANIVRPDDADEESMQGQIIEALANRDDNYKIEQDKQALMGRSRLVSRKKQEFYNIVSDRDVSAINTERLNSRDINQINTNVFDDGVEHIQKKVITTIKETKNY